MRWPATPPARSSRTPPIKPTDHAVATDVSSTVPRSGKIGRLGLEDAKQRNLIRLSLLLLAVITPVVVWRSHGQPLLAVWRISFLLCFVSSVWAYFLTKTMAARVLFHNSLGVLLAFLAHTALSPSIGLLIVLCSTHVAACLAGYALAEHRQHEGLEGSAALVPDKTKEEEATARPHLLQVAIMIPAYVLALLALVWHSADYPVEDLAGVVSFTLSAISLFGILFTTVMLRGRLVSPVGFSFVSVYFLVVFMSCLLIYQTPGGGAAMVIISGVGGVGLTGLFGYSLAVLATLKQIKR